MAVLCCAAKEEFNPDDQVYCLVMYQNLAGTVAVYNLGQ